MRERSEGGARGVEGGASGVVRGRVIGGTVSQASRLQIIKALLEHDFMQDAARKISRRGTRLNPPADKSKLQHLGTIDLGPDGPSIMQMFSLFDGFADWDPTSAIEMWAVQRFLSENRMAIASPGQAPLAIGDVMIDSDLIDLVDEKGVLSVKLRFEGTKIADSIADLLAKIGMGTLAL